MTETPAPETPARETAAPDLRRTSVRVVMSSTVVAVLAGSRLSEAVDIFVRTGLRHLVVVDATGRSVGILPQESVTSAWLVPASRRASRVHELVSHPYTSVHADTSVQEVAGLMSDTGLDAVPVVGRDGRLIGVVTRTDLVRLLAGEHELT
jgi:CBS domain-containing protein